MIGLSSLNNQFEKILFQKNDASSVLENEVILEICNLLEYFINLRSDSLVSNMINLFKQIKVRIYKTAKEKKEKFSIESEFFRMVEGDDIKLMYPNLFTCGIDEIDDKIKNLKDKSEEESEKKSSGLISGILSKVKKYGQKSISSLKVFDLRKKKPKFESSELFPDLN